MTAIITSPTTGITFARADAARVAIEGELRATYPPDSFITSVEGPFWQRSPVTQTTVEVQAEVRPETFDGREFYAVWGGGFNLSSAPFQEFPFFNSIEAAFEAARSNGNIISPDGRVTVRQFTGGEQIDGTGEFRVQISSRHSAAGGGRFGGGWD